MNVYVFLFQENLISEKRNKTKHAISFRCFTNPCLVMENCTDNSLYKIDCVIVKQVWWLISAFRVGGANIICHGYRKL